MALRYVLKAKGLEYPRDYKLQPAGPDAERTIGMSAGRIDASPLAVPFNFVAEELGFTAVGSILKSFPIIKSRCSRSIATGPSAIVGNSCSSNAAWFGPCVGSLTTGTWLSILSRRSSSSKPEYARRGYDFYKDKGSMGRQYEINIPGMKTTIAIYNETNPAKPATVTEKYIDQSFLSEALKGSAPDNDVSACHKVMP